MGVVLADGFGWVKRKQSIGSSVVIDELGARQPTGGEALNFR
jgi:hypothetical protein